MKTPLAHRNKILIRNSISTTEGPVNEKDKSEDEKAIHHEDGLTDKEKDHDEEDISADDDSSNEDEMCQKQKKEDDVEAGNSEEEQNTDEEESSPDEDNFNYDNMSQDQNEQEESEDGSSEKEDSCYEEDTTTKDKKPNDQDIPQNQNENKNDEDEDDASVQNENTDKDGDDTHEENAEKQGAKMDSLNQHENNDGSASSQEQNADKDKSLDVSLHDHSYSKSSVDINNEGVKKVESNSAKYMENNEDNVNYDGLVPYKEANNNDLNYTPSQTDNTSNVFRQEQNTVLTEAKVTHQVASEHESQRKKEKIHLVIEQLGMSTETEATVEDFELSPEAITDSFGSFDVEESSFHSVDDETILSALYSGSNQNMSEQNDGKYNLWYNLINFSPHTTFHYMYIHV